MTFPRADFASASNAFEREWLVTNALGGFACGTVAQANTRRYHGLLGASLQPPVQRVWMADGRNTTYLRFQLQDASAAMDLELRPLCTYRDYHSHARGGWSLEVADEPHGCRVTAFPAARPYRVLIDRGEFQREPDWYWNFYHRSEEHTSELQSPCNLVCRLLLEKKK